MNEPFSNLSPAELDELARLRRDAFRPEATERARRRFAELDAKRRAAADGVEPAADAGSIAPTAPDVVTTPPDDDAGEGATATPEPFSPSEGEPSTGRPRTRTWIAVAAGALLLGVLGGVALGVELGRDSASSTALQVFAEPPPADAEIPGVLAGSSVGTYEDPDTGSHTSRSDWLDPRPLGPVRDWEAWAVLRATSIESRPTELDVCLALLVRGTLSRLSCTDLDTFARDGVGLMLGSPDETLRVQWGPSSGAPEVDVLPPGAG